MKRGFVPIAEADWDAAKHEIRDILIELAKARQTITYSELTERLTSVSVHYHSYAFARLLIAACEDAYAAGEGRLCALVVTKHTGIPGGGFFSYAAEQGEDIGDPQVYWQAVLDEVFDHWAKQR